MKLFTENEKFLLLKYELNYFYSNKEKLIEIFSLQNSESDNDETNFK